MGVALQYSCGEATIYVEWGPSDFSALMKIVEANPTPFWDDIIGIGEPGVPVEVNREKVLASLDVALDLLKKDKSVTHKFMAKVNIGGRNYETGSIGGVRIGGELFRIEADRNSIKLIRIILNSNGSGREGESKDITSLTQIETDKGVIHFFRKRITSKTAPNLKKLRAFVAGQTAEVVVKLVHI